MYTYPFVEGAGLDITPADVHSFLKTPSLVARRVAELVRGRFISDFLLRGRYNVEGGAIRYLVDDGVYAKDDPEAIQAGAEYPLTTADEGSPQVAESEKEGRDSEVYDESIKRLLMNPVDRSLTKMVNSMIRHVDAKNLAHIASEVTATYSAGGTWTSPEQIIEDVLLADADFDDDDLGLNASVVVLTPTQFAKVASHFIKADLAANGLDAVASGVIPNVLGRTWVTSKYVPFSDPFLLDPDALGGIGVEDLQSPDYVTADGTLGIEVKTQRLVGSDDRDGYRLRVRRVGMAAIIEPRAGVRITGTGL